MTPYKSSPPRNAGETLDLLSWITFNSPRLEDNSGFFPGKNADTTFFELHEGIAPLRGSVAGEICDRLAALSDAMRVYFEKAAQDEGNDDNLIEGYKCLREMKDILLVDIHPKGTAPKR